MDSKGWVNIAIFCAALFVIADGIFVAFAPPAGDEPQAFALVVVGIFMILTGYTIAMRARD